MAAGEKTAVKDNWKLIRSEAVPMPFMHNEHGVKNSFMSAWEFDLPGGSRAYARATRDYGTAIQMIEHALAHNPSSAAAQSVPLVNSHAGHYETAVILAERSLRFSPFEPTRHLAHAALSRSRLFQGDSEAALTAARRAVQATPGHLPSHGYVVICLTRLGRLQERDTTVERLLASFPGVRLSHFLAHSTFAPFEDELAAAGLPL